MSAKTRSSMGVTMRIAAVLLLSGVPGCSSPLVFALPRSGTVLDLDTEKPVAGVEVFRIHSVERWLNDGNPIVDQFCQAATTDASGHFALGAQLGTSEVHFMGSNDESFVAYHPEYGIRWVVPDAGADGLTLWIRRGPAHHRTNWPARVSCDPRTISLTFLSDPRFCGRLKELGALE